MMEEPFLTEIHSENSSFSEDEAKHFGQFIAFSLAVIFMLLAWSTSIS